MKINIKALLTAVVVLSISACSSGVSRVKTVNGESLKNDTKISLKESKLYLVNGGDGRKKTYTSMQGHDEVAEGSGLSALNIAIEKLSMYSSAITTENQVLTEDKAIKIGAINGNDYVIYSRVETWTDPLGMNCSQYYYDEASVLLSIYSVKDDKLVNTSRLYAENCPYKVNGIPLKPGSPESLYSELFDKWIDKNFTK